MSAYVSRQRLTALMDQSRREQRLQWNDIARRAGISEPTLRRIRNKPESTLTEDAKARLEAALQWTPGDIDKVLAGGMYTYRRQVLDERAATVEQVMRVMVDMEINRRSDFHDLLTQIDARWFKH